MQREHTRLKVFSRRAALLAGGQGLLFAALAGRMYYLQVLQADRYATLAEENRISLRLLSPPRGRIVDRYGRPMALNQLNYRIELVPEQTPDVARTLDALQNIIPLSEREHRRILREVGRMRGFMPVTVRENLGWDEVAQIELNAPDLPGLFIDVGQSRYYPYQDATCHAVGYVAAVAEAEQTGDPLLELPGFRTGKIGIEKSHDAALRGRAGASRLEVNALGRVIRELERHEGEPGQEITLALDVGLQEFAARRMAGESGSAIVMDVQSGEILAMVSTPGFDPNAFNQGLGDEEWRALISHPLAPLTDKSISGQYAPGSTYKIVVALAALENNILTPDHAVFCPGYISLGDSRFHCWKKEGHGSLSMVNAIKQSCDVYFYDVARKVGVDRISDMARRLGLGQALKIDLPGERAGLIPTREWKLKTTGTPWQPGETLVAGIGQGYVLSTPLQLAVMTARVAGGKMVQPLMLHAGSTPPMEYPALDISSSSLDVVRHGMREVTSPGGTAYGARIPDSQFAMAGKTGTSQVRRISRAERLAGVRKNQDRPWEERDHALFVGYAPLEEPRFACAVVIEHGGGGSVAAAPVARDILLQAQKRALYYQQNNMPSPEPEKPGPAGAAPLAHRGGAIAQQGEG